MNTIATTRMSSKGQVVIPEEIRKELGLVSGSQFVVIGDNDVVILKSITPPSIHEFDDLIKKARKDAKKTNIKKSDISQAIATARRK